MGPRLREDDVGEGRGAVEFGISGGSLAPDVFQEPDDGEPGNLG
jgi:hypothetical protein